jgi:hypothetical protein
LDVSIIRHNFNKFKFKVYRKSTNNNRYIDGLSNHCTQQKYSSIAQLVHRAIYFPLNQNDRMEELRYIKEICVKNNLPPQIVDKYKNKYQRAKYMKSVTTLQKLDDSKHWSKMEYYPVLTEKLNKLGNNYGIRAAVKSSHSIDSYLPKTYRSGNMKYLPGIYQLSCNDCNSVYVGQTRSGFNQRFTQHERAIANNNPDSSNFAKHIIESGHDPLVNYSNNCKILAIEDNFVRRSFIEGCFIQKAVKNSEVVCVNAIVNPYYSSLVSYALQLDR